MCIRDRCNIRNVHREAIYLLCDDVCYKGKKNQRNVTDIKGALQWDFRENKQNVVCISEQEVE